MKIALVGPTGFVGSRVVDEASRRGHQLTAICRHPGKVPVRAGVNARAANILNRQEAVDAFAGHDAVISCYNCGNYPDPGQNVYKDTIEGVCEIIKATKLSGVRRLLFVGGAGSLYVAPGVQLLDAMGEPKGREFSAELLDKMPPEFVEWAKALPPSTTHDQIRPFVRALMLFEHDTTYDWSFFSPPAGMYPGKRTGKYALGGNELPMNGARFAGISIEDVAVALVDELETPRHTRRHWTAYYRE